MEITDKTRKQVYELTNEDLETCPIWIDCLDEEGLEGQDEATVKPWLEKGPVDSGAGLLVVRSTFTLANGKEMKGYINISGHTDRNYLGSLQPTMIIDAEQVNFWFGTLKQNSDQISQQYKLLGFTANEIFPINFITDIDVDHEGNKVQGKVYGFMHLTDPANNKFDVIN